MSDAGIDDPKEIEIRNLLPGYVLGILEPEELLAVDDYLAQHPRFWDDVHSLEQTASQLAYGAPSASPPVGTKEAVLSRVQPNFSQAPASTTSITPPSLNPEQASPAQVNPIRGSSAQRRPNQPPRQMAQGMTPGMTRGVARGVAQRRPMDAPLPKRSWVRSFGDWWTNALGWKMYALATTAAIALIAVLFGQTQNELTRTLSNQMAADEEIAQLKTEQESLAAQLNALASENSERSTEAETLRIASTQLESQLAQLQADLADLESEKGDLLQTVELLEAELGENELIFASLSSMQQVVALQGIGPTPDAIGTLLSGPDGEYLVLSGLEPLPDNQTYQLWLITDEEEAIDSGLVTVTPESTAPLAVNLTLDPDDFAAVGLSIEPAGGSDTPTPENIVLLGTKI